MRSVRKGKKMRKEKLDKSWKEKRNGVSSKDAYTGLLKQSKEVGLAHSTLRLEKR